MGETDHILVVDDDAEIRSLLGTYLRKNGFRVSVAANGREMRTALETAAPDLIVLDLMLPGEDGLALCRDLRSRSDDVPIIMLTARGEDVDRILGLEMGADDYLPKPFNPRELLARINGVLRRARSLPPQPRGDVPAGMLRFAGWTLDTVARELLSPDGVVVPLSGGEYRLLRVFLEHPNRILNRDQLMDLTRGREAAPFDRSIDVQISRLRTALGEDARNPQILKTVRNEGYILAAPVERA
ncbi:MAG TPA: response regulator [Gammaproteobacteria bacterium]|nr:response regulator [Gammaproteobacteria bacterium]